MQAYLKSKKQLWDEALYHPFIKACSDGSIRKSQFEAWLVQDNIYVLEFMRFMAQTLAHAPPEHYSVLISGLSALDSELDWYKEKLAERGLSRDVEVLPGCNTYIKMMQSFADKPYPVQIMAVWAIEYAYSEAWATGAGDPDDFKAPYNEFANRWGSKPFREYVDQLAQKAQEALQGTSKEVRKEAEAVCDKIASYEVDFWQMAFDA
ncbi:hypothetical protein WJX73_005745 [Symbiochloris irregularis]|uniref:Thiaminase-2/PQQC domain-containing protein n=1 Tax=Symbiochloris irregularis TaxID=706552 RepID=A0AAW1NTV3_9CHLO